MLKLHPGRLLISMDAGWYNVGVPAGGNIRDYNFMADEFLPALRKAGVGDADIRRLTVDNPAKAFALAAKSNQ
jgi:phosphotriesterase-related protein